MRVIPDNVDFVEAFLLKLSVDAPHADTFVLCAIPTSHVSPFINLKKYSCVRTAPEKVNACEAPPRMLGGELDDVLPCKGYLQTC